MKVALQPETVAFSSKGQLVIPRRLRKEFEIEEGTRAYIQSTPDGILIRPVTAKFIHGVRGKYKNLPLLETLKESKRGEKEK